VPNYRFKQVDVFTQRPFKGNPVAVILEASDFSTAEMQQIAAWTNLSETTFVLPPTDPDQADYRLRIFTPKQELPFAGHPTIGSAHAVIESGMLESGRVQSGQIRQECAAGVIPISVQLTPQGQRILAQAPPATVTPLDSDLLELFSEVIAAAVLPPLRVDVGPVWIVADLGQAEAVAQLQPDLALISQLSEIAQATGMTVFGRAQDGLSQMQVRSFAPLQGIAEDPVCGSGNISVAAYLIETGLVEAYGAEYLARQGMQVGRNGQIQIRIQQQQIEFGGYAVTCIDGTIQPR
jgi:PhzF family phenazine biosynthesis protein